MPQRYGPGYQTVLHNCLNKLQDSQFGVFLAKKPVFRHYSKKNPQQHRIRE